eukprot:12412698-Karenia_brevis.AAC.1
MDLVQWDLRQLDTMGIAPHWYKHELCAPWYNGKYVTLDGTKDPCQIPGLSLTTGIRAPF